MQITIKEMACPEKGNIRSPYWAECTAKLVWTRWKQFPTLAGKRTIIPRWSNPHPCHYTD